MTQRELTGVPRSTARATRSRERHATAVRSARRLLDRWTSRLALLGCLMSLTAGIALALPAEASAATIGFHVYNLSDQTLRVVSTGGDFFSKPDDGDSLDPGSYQDFEVTSYFFIQNDANVAYAILDKGGVRQGELHVKMNVGDAGFGSHTSSCQAITISGVTLDCSADDETINFLDPPGTNIDVPAGQGQAQADVLNQLCHEDSAATCTFKVDPNGETNVDSPTHPVGNALVNNTDEDQDTSFSVSDTLAQSDSVSITAKVQVALSKIIDLSIQSTYGHMWTNTHTFTQTVDVHCPAHNRCAISAAQPMLRDVGDFTVSMGNTTWHLPGVYFDTPNPDGSGSYIVDSTPLSQAEQATLPPTFQGEKSASVSYSVPTPVIEQPTADAKLQVTIDGPANATPGQTAEDRITITPTEPTGRMVYPVDALHVHTEIDGRDGHDSTISTAPLDQSRTVPLSFEVPATSDGRVCVTVDATADHAEAGHSQYCATEH